MVSLVAPDMNADSTKDGLRVCQFTKTKLCKFNVLGKCTKGLSCPFAHENQDLRKLPDLRRTKLCKVLIQTGQCSKKSCMYAHSKEELRSTGAYHKTKLCRFMQTGHCTLGGKCNFAHSAVELREPETIETLELDASGLDAPPGLGLESMIGGLLSDDDEDSSDGLGYSANVTDLAPAYVHLPRALQESLAVGKSSLSEESTDCEDAFAAFSSEDARLGSLWSYQSQLAASNAIDFQLGGGLGCYAPDVAYGGAFHDWNGMWSGSPMADPYAGSSLAGGYNPWDWQPFGGSSIVDKKK